jgi:hypothetical protein
MANQEQREALNALAYAHGLELEIEEDDDAPMLWAVWAWKPECETYEDADIIGAGDSESEAIEEARKQLRIWESNAREIK